ncbi:TnsA-like heteromeric transposase endonuclease subunit [Kitasatospora sp. NBC_01250]|uniref:TnsA-like heteromeric transposase endonuclease subunit n=1 Tax=Kitasatospora sp. NBC_01250 TaxID=2903571 RepID=UPI002E3402C2|nr:TnsA-like heteromeric transposase endonuclease subunit [Kitasatospora sp. NBC_01250]
MDVWASVSSGEDGASWVDPRVLRGEVLEEAPSSIPATYPGRQGIATGWWASTTGALVECGTEVERRGAVFLDFDPSVAGFAASRVRLRWQHEDQRGTVAPVFFARTCAGQRLAVVHPPRPGTRGRHEREALHVAAEAAGWALRELGPPDGIRIASLERAAAFRFPEFDDPQVRTALRKTFSVPRPLQDGVAAAGLLPGSNSRAYHLLWTGDLMTDWSRPLLPTSTVWTSTEDT